MWLKSCKIDSGLRNVFDEYFFRFIFPLDKVFTRKLDILTVILSKIQGKPKNFATFTFSL